MKYLRYLAIIVFKLVSKLIGIPMFFIAVPFRAYARNTVHNYILRNKVHLPRLYEREPTLIGGEYVLKNIHNVKIQGTIEFNHVSKLRYYLTLWLLWIWVDDDSNHDTMSGGERSGMVYGNAFDLGDVRGRFPEFKWKESTLWMLRNTAYNFNYVFEECAEDSKYFFYYKCEHLNWHFGFIPYTNSVRRGRLVFFNEDFDKLD